MYSDDRLARIISAPGGLWQLQHWRKDLRAWQDAGRPVDLDAARRSLGA